MDSGWQSIVVKCKVHVRTQVFGYGHKSVGENNRINYKC